MCCNSQIFFYFQTGNLLAFAFLHLAKNPDAQEKLYQEVSKASENTSSLKAALQDMPYLKGCVKETLRFV